MESLEFRIDNGTDGGIIVKLSESVIQKEIQSILFRLFDINRDGKIDFGEVSIIILVFKQIEINVFTFFFKIVFDRISCSHNKSSCTKSSRNISCV